MHIHKLLKKRGEAGLKTFVLQIGANDGATFDPVYDALQEYDWPALLVEPLPDFYEQLCSNYKARALVKCANVAIAGHSGAITMHRVDPDVVEGGMVPAWGHGAASLYTDRNALAFEDVRPHVQEVSVPCLTLPDLLAQHNIQHIDVLQMDCEGHDFAILKQLDFTRFKPAIINLEIVNLPEDEQGACRTLLSAQGYRHKKNGYDLLAVRDDG